MLKRKVSCTFKREKISLDNQERIYPLRVSQSPSTIVHPNAQNEDIGARSVVPSSFAELTTATGVPK
jgi:hypothetical protein